MDGEMGSASIRKGSRLKRNVSAATDIYLSATQFIAQIQTRMLNCSMLTVGQFPLFFEGEACV